MLLKVFHVCVFSLNIFAIWYDQAYVDLPFPYKEMEAMCWRARHLFLTWWCLIFQSLFYIVSLLNDIYGTNSPAQKNPPLIRRIKDVMFSMAFTFAIYVSVTFWGIYAINKDLIYPIEISSRVPVWLNHVMHTYIGPFILIELLATNVKYPSRKFGFGLVMTLISIYVVYTHLVYFQKGIWAYPFMVYFGWPMRIMFLLVSTVIGYGVYILGEKLNKLVCSKDKLHLNGVNGIKKKY